MQYENVEWKEKKLTIVEKLQVRKSNERNEKKIISLQGLLSEEEIACKF